MERRPFPLLDAMPAQLRSVMVDFQWSRERLWALELPVERVGLHELRWHLALPMWSFEGVPFTVSPQDVGADPDRYHAQYARTMAADLEFPLHLLVRARDAPTILDGVHRLLKAELLGHRTVDVKKVPMSSLDAIACR